MALLGLASVLLFLTRLTARLWSAEKVVHEYEDRFEYLFQAQPIGVALMTAGDGRFLRVNAAFARMLGYSPHELVGRRHNEFSPATAAPPDGASDLGWTPTDEHYVTRSGDTVPVRVRASRLPAANAAEPPVLVFTEDVTEQRRLEETLRQTQKMDALGQLAGGMAHDFNNLLGIIIGNLDMLQPMLPEAGEAGELIDATLVAALRGAGLTQRLLAFARRQPLRPDRIDLNARITETIALLSRILGVRIRVALDLAPDVWPVLVDATQLEACIINMAANARDAMPGGGTLTIATGNRRLDADATSGTGVTPGDFAMIEIRDSGTGMPPETLARVFEPFFTTKGPDKGTGLGLSMVMGFLKQSNGHIIASSQPGCGTIFRLYFPRIQPASSAPWPRAAPIRQGHGEPVLVVEDKEPLRRVAVRRLQDLGYAVLEADGAAAALCALAQHDVALVFTDVVMPGDLDGHALAREIHARFPSTKVLLTSGYPGPLNPSDAPDSERILSKPYRTDDLARAIRELLEQ